MIAKVSTLSFTFTAPRDYRVGHRDFRGEGDRLHLESMLKELRVRLDLVPAFARVERYTAAVAS